MRDSSIPAPSSEGAPKRAPLPVEETGSLTRFSALNFKIFQNVDLDLERFQVLVGPNATGKSTLLGGINFLGLLASLPYGIEDVPLLDSPNFDDLTWMKRSPWFELAVELSLPEAVQARLVERKGRGLRYEVRVGYQDDRSLAILNETLWLLPFPRSPRGQVRPLDQFPYESQPPRTILWEKDDQRRPALRKILHRVPETGNVYYGAEVGETRVTLKVPRERSALGALWGDEEKFPGATWCRDYLSSGVQRLVLGSRALRTPSPPATFRKLRPDGGNIPWVIEELKDKDPESFAAWVAHVKTALPDIKGIRTVERPEDRHRYLVVEYESGLDAPSWMVSDGTLRMLVLTLIAYLPASRGLFLIEEPENGIHPKGVETVYEALSRAYGSQVFIATHSPVMLSVADPFHVLCFAKTATGAAAIVRGDRHPKLADWKGETDLGTLFASGVLG